MTRAIGNRQAAGGTIPAPPAIRKANVMPPNSAQTPIADCRLPTAGLREAELHTLWLEQRFPPGALTTVAGQPVRVLYRGRPGGGPGPDFRDARISIGGATPRLGDVELHVAEPDFRRHGHQRDPAYARVVLHVVFDAAGAEQTDLPGGGVAPLLALRPWAERRSAEIAAWLERSVPWREPCFTAIPRLGPDTVRTVLHAGGLRRLQEKARALAAGALGALSEQHLYRAICGALGLTRNVEPFYLLAERLPLAPLLAGCALLPDEEAIVWLRDHLRAQAGFSTSLPGRGGLPWRLEGLRPNAHPAKRLDGLALLLVRHRHAGLERSLNGAARSGASSLLRAIQAPGIGQDRAVEVAMNAVIPYLIARGEEESALAIAEVLPPASSYGPLVTLSAALIGAEGDSARPARPLVMTGALMQQGGLALHRDWCRRGGCGLCPLS